MAHAEQAFRSANGLSLTVALMASLIASVAVAVYLTRRLDRSVRPLSTAAVEVSVGRYDVRVPPPGLGAEFDDLADAFNRMAGQLQRVEQTRRRLLGDLAHELRTPVATLDAYLDGLEDGVATLECRDRSRFCAPRPDASAAWPRTSPPCPGPRNISSRCTRFPLAPAELVAAAVAVAAGPVRRTWRHPATRRSPGGCPPSRPTPTGWDRSWATSSTMPCATPRPRGASRCRRTSNRTAASGSRYVTPAKALPSSTFRTCLRTVLPGRRGA